MTETANQNDLENLGSLIHKKAYRRNNTYQRSVNRKKLSLLNFYWSDTLWLHLPYYEISIFFIFFFHFLAILLVQFFKYCG